MCGVPSPGASNAYQADLELDASNISDHPLSPFGVFDWWDAQQSFHLAAQLPSDEQRESTMAALQTEVRA
jgi:hypothetical protein